MAEPVERVRGRIYLVGAGPGGADLITVRGWRALQRADCVLYDHLVEPALYRGLDAELIPVGKRRDAHSKTQDEINALMVELSRRHRHVVRLKGGDPFVLGRGSEEAGWLAAHGVDVEVVPGVTSAIAVPAAAGIPVTHRGIADSFCVVSAHPRDETRPISLPPYDEQRTLVLLMGVRTMPVWRRRLLELGYPPDLPVAFVRWGGTPSQEVCRETLRGAGALAGALEPPVVAVVGRVVGIGGLAGLRPGSTGG